MEPECNFWGVKIPPGAAAEVSPAFKEDFITSVHLTQVALGDKPKPGGHTIFIEKGGEKFALGTLDKDRCTHFSLDIHLATDTIRLSHTGKSDVYLTGYEAVSVATDDEPGFPGMIQSDDEEEESEEESEEDSEDEEAPQGVPMGKSNRMVMIDDEAEEGSSDDEEEDGSEEDGEDGLMASGEEDSDEDEEDESDEDEEDEEEEEEESSEEEEEPVPQPQPQPKSGSKRAQPPASATPQPPKRSKQEAATGKQRAPATAPPKVASAPTPSGGNGEYLAALKSYLSTHGPTKLATLGSVVKRPPKVPKLKHFLEQNKGVFKYNMGTDAVSLA